MADQAPATGKRHPLYRVVDRDNQGWYPASDGRRGVIYTARHGASGDLAPRSFEQLATTRGPLRPVKPVTDADIAALHHLFVAAGRKTITTLAAAIETVYHQLRQQRGRHHDSFEFARRTLVAGREGSWESVMVIEIVLFGNELNLAPATRKNRYDTTARRAAGPMTRRVDAAARDHMAGILHRWVSGPGRYTEVAETLAGVVSAYCDTQPDGWRAVADQWLQPGGLAQQNFSLCYRLFYSRSEHFDTTVI